MLEAILLEATKPDVDLYAVTLVVKDMAEKQTHPIVKNYLVQAWRSMEKGNLDIAIPCISLALAYYD